MVDDIIIGYHVFDKSYGSWIPYLRVANSTDGGTTWTTNNIESSQTWTSTSIKYIGNSLYFCYLAYGSTTESTGLKFCKSLDKGLTWDTQFISITNHGSDEYGSVMACPDENTIFILTVDTYDYPTYNLRLYRSLDRGSTWTNYVVDIDTWDSNIEICAPNTNTVFVTYNDYNGEKLKFAKSTDGGETWTTKTLTDCSVVSYSETQSICATDSNNIFIAYCCYLSGPNNLNLATSTDGGATWSTSLVHAITENRGYMWKVSMTIPDNNNIFIAYHLFDNLNSKRYAALVKSNDGGNTWNVDIQIGLSEHYFDILAKDPQTLYISHGGAFAYKYGQLYSGSTDGGTTWTNNIVETHDPLLIYVWGYSSITYIPKSTYESTYPGWYSSYGGWT